MVIKNYSDFAFAIDLIIDVYKTNNPVIIEEKAYQDLGMDLSIHQISDYLSLNKEDYEKESRKQYYLTNY